MIVPAALLTFSVLLAAAPQPAAAGGPNAACKLLTFADVRGVQKATVKETKESERIAGGQRHATCVFATTDFVHSVSLTLTTGPGGSAEMEDYWARTFRRDAAADKEDSGAARLKRADPPLRRIEGLGRDAVWTGDAKAGSLYVLTRDSVLRISVGGVTDVAERLRRSRELAAIAVRRWEKQQPVRQPPR